MNWIYYALVMYISSVVIYLALRVLQNNKIPSEVNNFFMWAFSALTFVLIAIYNWQFPQLEIKYIIFLFCTAFFLSYWGQIFSFEGIRKSPNPGYSLMIQKSYAVFTTVAAVFLFGSELTSKNVIAIIMVIAFLTLILKSDEKENSKQVSKGWILDSFVAFFLFGINALAAKWLLDQGVDPFVRGFYVMIFLFILFAFDILRKSNVNNKFIEHLKTKKLYPWFILMGVANGFFNLSMQYAYDYTPNVGYVNIINTASIAAITVLSAILFNEKLGLKKFIGILGVTGGIVLLLL